MTRRSIALVLVAMMLSALAAAQPYAPIVTMVVTMPDGRTQELTAAESGLATLTLKDGTEYGFRPTIQDSAPWNRIVVTVFKSATNSAPTTVLGEIELRRGGPAMDSKTTPSFKVSVPKVSGPTSQTEWSKATVKETYQGPINTSRIPPNLGVSGPKSPDRDSVLTCPDLPFADTTAAQFAAQWPGGGAPSG